MANDAMTDEEFKQELKRRVLAAAEALFDGARELATTNDNNNPARAGSVILRALGMALVCLVEPE